jgi:hypothetical protein
VFSDGPFAQLPSDGLEVNLGRPARLYEVTEYTTAINFGALLGLDKLTDGFYQPLTLEGDGTYARQGFFHSCGATAADEVVVPTTEASRLYAVRVWNRCDCCEDRGAGLQVLQQVQVGDITEWRACEGITTEIDTKCFSENGPENQFWERVCDHTVKTIAIKVARVEASGDSAGGDSARAIDIPEIEAFGAIWISPTATTAATDLLDFDGAELLDAEYTAGGASGCDDASAQPQPSSETTQTQPLKLCTVTTSTRTTVTLTTVATTPPETPGLGSGSGSGSDDLDGRTGGSSDDDGGGLTSGTMIAVAVVALVLLGAGAAIVYRKQVASTAAAPTSASATAAATKSAPLSSEGVTTFNAAFSGDDAAVAADGVAPNLGSMENANYEPAASDDAADGAGFAGVDSPDVAEPAADTGEVFDGFGVPDDEAAGYVDVGNVENSEM